MKKQLGSALIIVLVILVLVTLIGTLAVRSGILGLKLATNSQIQSLLLENSNSALFNLENPAQVRRQLAGDGMYYYFDKSENAADELVFCYRAAQSSFFSLSKASAIQVASDGTVTTTKIGIDGYCKASQFATGRSAILSQVYLTKVSTASAPFSAVPKGSSLGQGNIPATTNNIGATVISVLPSFASATSTQIEACFKRPSIKPATGQTVGECFDNLGIPYNMQHADYVVGGQPKLVS